MPEFKVLKGGLVSPVTDKYRFQDAVCTDTRLMGVLGLRVHWKDFTDPLDPEDIYHFYYYDIEEIGLDYLQISKVKDEEELALLTKRNFGGLGAGYWPLSEDESRYLICTFAEETKRKHQPLPENIADELFFGGSDPGAYPGGYPAGWYMTTRSGTTEYFILLDAWGGSGPVREATLALGQDALLQKAAADIASEYPVIRQRFGMLLATA